MVAAYFVYGTEIFLGREVSNLRYDFFRDHRVGTNAKWLSLCPHGSELRRRKQARELVCRECGQAHSAWVALESRTTFLSGQQSRNDRYEPLVSLVLFHEDDQPLPGKYLIGLPPELTDGAIVLWRIVVPEANYASISTLGLSLYRSTGEYSESGKTFHAIEMLAIISRGQGMAVSTTDWRSALTWNGSQINFQTHQRIPDTVNS